MRYLLDTHCWLWWNIEPERLNQEAHQIISESGNELFLSTASAWEISIKHAIGRLRLPVPPKQYIPDRLYANQITGLPIGLEHVLHVNELPHHHRDPFDRVLIAQAIVEQLTLVTADDTLRQYDVKLLWAGQ